MRGSIMLAVLAFTCGYSARDLYPTKRDREMASRRYHIACLSGQISILDMIYNKAKFESCDDIEKKEVKDVQ